MKEGSRTCTQSRIAHHCQWKSVEEWKMFVKGVFNKRSYTLAYTSISSFDLLQDISAYHVSTPGRPVAG